MRVLGAVVLVCSTFAEVDENWDDKSLNEFILAGYIKYDNDVRALNIRNCEDVCNGNLPEVKS